MEALKPSEVKTAASVCFQAGRAPMIHGEPGIGKSEVVRQIADAMFAEKYGYQVQQGTLYQNVNINKGVAAVPKWEPVPDGFVRPWFRDIRVALLDAVDLRGVPHVEGKKTSWAVPAFLPTDDRGGIFFLDEINRGSEMAQNGCFSLVLTGELGEYRLPANWVPAAAVNDLDIGARKMSHALQARFVHIDMKADLDDLCAHAIEADWAPETIAFLRFRPNLVHSTPEVGKARTERVSPNPRAWSFVSQLTKQGLPPEVELSLLAGTVGAGAAVEYIAFMKLYRTLPSIDVILLDPGRAQVPTQPATLYAVASAVARRATPDNLTQVLTYIDRLPVEYAVSAVRDMTRRDQKLQTTKGMVTWLIKHKDVLL